MKRRMVTLVLAVCLLISGLTGFAAPQIRLVCRLSGQPMVPVFEAAPAANSKTAPCCRVQISQAASPVGPAFSLQPGSCCVLHVGAAPGPLPPSSLPSSFTIQLALLPARPLDVPHPIFAFRALAVSFTSRTTPPRAPPAYPVTGRAPPVRVFS